MSVCVLTLLAALSASGAVEFNRDIRAIFSDKCYTCHGPDNNNRKANLRLDREESAKGSDTASKRPAIVPGDPAASELVARITSPNKATRMPPAYTGAQPLAEAEIALIRQWIGEGAKWQKHWSLEPPRHEPPPVARSSWPKTAIDRFILARMEKEGLHPRPEADRATLLRRLSLDLTGIPPTPAELSVFLADKRSDAYEKQVDRLLASSRYGEKMAIRWLDAARYADTNGYQTDAERYMWRWRDWVIESFNRNQPFNQFVIEQLAGDLLPNPTLDQIIATGFNRNHRGNGEGGSLAEEFIVEYWVDRVETASTVFMGLTMGCARCHDHKYDPLTQRDFYSMVSFFNNIDEMGRVFKYGNSPPMIPAPTRDQQVRLRELEAKVRQASQAFQARRDEAARAQRAWEAAVAPGSRWQPREALLANYPLEPDAGGLDSAGKALKAGFKDGAASYGEGRLDKAATFDGRRYVDAGAVGTFGYYNAFTVSAWIYATAPDGAIVTKAKDVEEESGWGLYLKDGKLQVNLVQRWLDDSLRVETTEPIPLNQWRHVAMTYDSSRIAKGVTLYVDGREVAKHVVLDELNQNFQTREPLRIGAGNGKRFHGSIDEVRIYNEALPPEEVAILAVPEILPALAAIDSATRSAAQSEKLRQAFLDQYGPDDLRASWHGLRQARRELAVFSASVPTVMIMREMEKPRRTYVLTRGAYDRPADEVSRSTPAALPPMSPDLPRNRLGLARWLTSPEHPLTARVTVNRFWQMLFGAGLVRTVEDFGSQGEPPSHPELLDWLATEFVRTGWDVKGVVKTIVMSAAYRQDSNASPDLLQKDPENRLLARGPRFRLPAEMVRDQALSLAGLLVERVGGPSVKPYQPAGLWEELSGQHYTPDRGDGLYRRSLYTYWKRSSPPPGMMTFDSAGREACTVRENRTNTPLQALTLMNDETYVEAARKMAERMIHEGGASPESRIAYGFRLATARAPKATESTVLLRGLHHYLDRYSTNPEAAAKLLANGDSDADKTIAAPELAAYSSVASLILNLDETITKE
ncbi:MAG: DUF1553 domain-containing protein [Bryobacteraceae bacterium]